MSTFPQPADSATFADLVRRQQADWSLPQNDPRKWYVEDAGIFDLVMPFEGYRTADEFVAGANQEFFNKAARADFTLKDVVRVTHLSSDVVLTEVFLHGSAQLKTGGEPMEVDVRQTQVWVRRNDQWLVFHEHNSTPLPAPNG